MFHGERWAETFISVSEDAEAGLAWLKAFAPLSKTAYGIMSGRSAARRLELIMRESVSAISISGEERAGAEYVIRFISLLAEKNYFKHIDPLVEKIETRLDGKKGILTVTVESALPMDGAFEEGLARSIAERTGAAGVKLKTALVPELIGGYRLRIGEFFVDASLKGQLESMTAELAAMPVSPVPGGGM